MSTIHRVRAIIMKAAGPNAAPIGDDTPLFFDGMNGGNVADGNVMLDSLDRIEIAMELEEEFDIAIPDDDVDQHQDEFSSISRITQYIDRRLGEVRV